MRPSLETFHTARLIAKRIEPRDFDALAAMDQDERVMATLGGPRTLQETREALRGAIAHWEQYGYGTWILHDRKSGEFVGRAGLRRIELDGRSEVELWYAAMPPFWGKGLITEIARELVQIGHEQLQLRDIIAFTLVTNRASQRVLEKCGMRRERERIRAGLPHVFYRTKTVL